MKHLLTIMLVMLACLTYAAGQRRPAQYRTDGFAQGVRGGDARLIPPAPYSYYPFTDKTNLTDYSGNGHKGIWGSGQFVTNSLGTTWYQPGADGKPEPQFLVNQTTQGTYAAWVNNGISGELGMPCLYMYRGNATNNMVLHYSSAGYFTAVRNDAGTENFTCNLGGNSYPAWSFVTVTWKPTELRVYFNGTLRAFDTTVTGTYPTNSAGAIRFKYYWSCPVTRLYIYSEYLTAYQVLGLYQSQPPYTSLF